MYTTDNQLSIGLQVNAGSKVIADEGKSSRDLRTYFLSIPKKVLRTGTEMDRWIPWTALEMCTSKIHYEAYK